MGVEPYWFASSLIGTIVQRLVRRVCPSAATAHAEEKMLESVASRAATGLARRHSARAAGATSACIRIQGPRGPLRAIVVEETIRRMTVDHSPSSEMRLLDKKSRNAKRCWATAACNSSWQDNLRRGSSRLRQGVVLMAQLYFCLTQPWMWPAQEIRRD